VFLGMWFVFCLYWIEVLGVGKVGRVCAVRIWYGGGGGGRGRMSLVLCRRGESRTIPLYDSANR